MSLDTRAHWAAALGAGCLLALGACTAKNPAFGEGDGEDDGEPNPATSTSEGEPTTTRTNGDSDGRTVTSDPDASASEPTTLDTSDPDTGNESGDVCLLHPEAWIEMAVTRDFDALDLTTIEDLAECEQIKVATLDGALSFTETGIHHFPCGACPCPSKENPTNAIDFDGTLELVEGPPCGRLVAWTAFRPDRGGCVWDGFAVLPPMFDGGELPVVFGSNSLVGRAQPLPGVVPTLPVEQACDNPLECDPKPGAHALTFANVAVEVSAPQHVVFPDLDAEYEITNRMSSIDPDCHELVSYTGVLIDGDG